jgi:hypothetical protein
MFQKNLGSLFNFSSKSKKKNNGFFNIQQNFLSIQLTFIIFPINFTEKKNYCGFPRFIQKQNRIDIRSQRKKLWK